MFPHIRTCRRNGALSALLIFFLVALAAAAAAPANETIQDLSHLYLVPDASCAGHEGQWNCLSDRFQHCAGGQWSAVLSCAGGAESAGVVDGGSTAAAAAAGSLCSPLGRTDLVDFEGECSAAWSWGSSGGGGWGGGGGTSCNGNRCYYGAGARLGAGQWVYASVVGVVLLGLW